MRPAETGTARVAALCVGPGDRDGLGKQEVAEIEVTLGGIVGDRHRGFSRESWAGDKETKGTVRRNERQWSAVSREEVASISNSLGLAESMDVADLGANLCLEGLDGFSLKGWYVNNYVKTLAFAEGPFAQK